MKKLVELARSAFSGQVDIAWLAALRVLFGAIMTVSMLRFLGYGWVERLFVEPTFFFKYPGFSWVAPLPSPYMRDLFVLMTGLALSVALGFYYRVTAPLFALGLAYVQLIDVSTYLNHYYLAFLLAFLLAFAPAHRAFSLDAYFAKRSGAEKFGASRVWSGWLVLFRGQITIVYSFAGLAKLGPDWLLHAQPLRIWLGQNTDLPLIGPLFTLSWVPLAMSWFGFLFDLTIAWFMMNRRARPFAYVVVIVFHVATRLLFPIGMFPFIMVLGALVFFSPSWPRLLLAALTKRPALTPTLPAPSARLPLGSWVIVSYLALMTLVPLRHLAYGGNVLWHEQGLRLSWRVMLRAKGGVTTYRVVSPSGRTWDVNPSAYLNGLQENEMAGQPDLIVQLAHHIARDFAKRGFENVAVYADSRVSLNGRPSRPFIDPLVDLTKVEDGLGKAEYVLPAPTSPPPHTRPVL